MSEEVFKIMYLVGLYGSLIFILVSIIISIVTIKKTNKVIENLIETEENLYEYSEQSERDQDEDLYDV